jgi:APA family basic amino acid/polyamine antiporter
MVVGIIVGASIFVQQSEIARHVPSAGGVLSIWLVAGALTLFGSLVCAELSSVYPRTGGVYVFLKETLSPSVGFLWGWTMFWMAHSGIIAASSMIFARYVAFFVPMSDGEQRLVAIAAIAALSFVNYLGVRQGSRLQTTVTIAKLAAVAILLIFAALFSNAHPAVEAAAPATTFAASFGTSEFMLGVSAALFAFGGWHMVTYVAGEAREASRTIPRALLIGICIVTACYIGLNAAYLHILSVPKVIASTRVAADAASALAGPGGAALISALVILSSVGVLNGVILAGPRTYYAMAQEGLAFGWLGKAHPRFQTPHRATILQAIWSCVLVATGTYRLLFSQVVYSEWIFFALMAVGLLRLRARPGYKPPYRAWGGPFVPGIFAACALGVTIIQGIAAIRGAAHPWQVEAGIGLVVIGLPIYYLRIRSHANH